MARRVAPSENRIKFPPPIKLMVETTINTVPRTPRFELHPAPPKKHLKPNDQLKNNIIGSHSQCMHVTSGENSGLVQTSNFSCAEPNANDPSSLFELICIRFGT